MKHMLVLKKKYQQILRKIQSRIVWICDFYFAVELYSITLKNFNQETQPKDSRDERVSKETIPRYHFSFRFAVHYKVPTRSRSALWVAANLDLLLLGSFTITTGDHILHNYQHKKGQTAVYSSLYIYLSSICMVSFCPFYDQSLLSSSKMFHVNINDLSVCSIN